MRLVAASVDVFLLDKIRD